MSNLDSIRGLTKSFAKLYFPKLRGRGRERGRKEGKEWGRKGKEEEKGMGEKGWVGREEVRMGEGERKRDGNLGDPEPRERRV